MIKDFPLGKTFYVMRHAETDDNKGGLVSGSGREPSLTENGKEQAVAVCSVLEKLNPPINLVVTSEMGRTKETADIIFDDTIAKIIDAGINERSYGSADGISEQERQKLKASGAVSGEESKEDVKNRAVEAVKRNLGGDKTPLFITHGGVILRLFGIALGGEKAVDKIKNAGRKPKNCAVYEFKTPEALGGKWQVSLLSLS